MLAVIILHNMTVEDESGSEMEGNIEYEQTPRTKADITTNGPNDSTFEQFMLRYQAIRDHKAHNTLQNNLIDHLWNKHGSDEDSSPSPL